MSQSRLVGIFGAAPDTGNLGVSALLFGTLGGLSEALDGFTPVVFDHGTGVRHESLHLVSNELAIVRCGAYLTKRLYRPEALPRIRASARLGGVGSPATRLLEESDAVLDLSGGDSFTDLYGDWRFRSITLPKLITLEMDRPLFLLPQTYGPFSDAGRRKVAQDILRRVGLAWARDPWSYTKLQELLGDAFDPDRHREGVDVAFLLEAAPPAEPLPVDLNGWLDDSGTRVAGINVSGLLYHGGETAREQYGLRSDYKSVVTGLVKRFLDDTDWALVLVPHVTVEEGHHESDTAAALALARSVGEPDRVTVAPPYRDPRHVKWLISKLDWFCGTRMHSTIAAMSSGVPTAALAYSDKTLGVFQTCGQGQQVADLRTSDTMEIIEHVMGVWRGRDTVRGGLADRLPAVFGAARRQMEELAAAIIDSSDPVGS